jgi:hypothetical protein
VMATITLAASAADTGGLVSCLASLLLEI